MVWGMRLVLFLLAIAGLALAATDSDYLWVEGESPARGHGYPHPWYSEQVQKGALSGGAWLSSFTKQADTEVGYDLSVPHAGDWTLWARLNPVHSKASWRLGDGAWSEADSGKFARLREIAEVIAAKQEKALVFTQFREATAPVAAFLGAVFGRPGLVLHGGTEVKKRKDLVRQFQEDETVPFFVLSLKAGGSGLNLTAASHVVHFDRWWNPAVENQATDRAFRIGQKKNVLVHKFVCLGTVEEKIDKLIEAKRGLSRDLLEGGAELLLTEMKDDELLKLVALDIHSAEKDE